MDRRTLLKTGAMGLAGLGLGACSSGAGRRAAIRPPLRLPPVRADWDRVIRTTVGLRPHRPSGFVLRADRLDGKVLVHNYGHGGSGMSLTWGTGQMAAELALEQEARTAAVIGSGAAGLTTARQLQRRGFDVTIYAMSVPPDTTSNMSLAGWTPTSGLVDDELRTAGWDAQFRRAAEIAYRQLQLLVGRDYGISWIDSYALDDDPPRERTAGEEGRREPLLPPHLQTGRLVLGPGEHPFPTRYATRRTTMRFEPSIYLDALVRDFLAFGGHIVIRKFDSPRDLAALDEPVVINCAGLGAGELFGDREIMPVKGQLTVLVPQPEVEYGTFGGLPGGPSSEVGIHMQPRTDGIVLGGTAERGQWSLEPDEEARQRVIDAHVALFSAMVGA